LAGNPGAEIIVIDEVQKVRALLDEIHGLIESAPAPRWILTGSSARKLRRSGTGLLGGRAALRSMPPFMAAELGDDFDLGRALLQGLLPLVWDSAEPGENLRGYVGVYLKEEIQMEGLVRNLDGFSRFLEAASFSQASVLNISEVARECQISRKTVEGHIEILEDLLLGWRLPVFTRRAKRKLTSHPKFYWFDAGVYRSVRPTGPLDRPEEIAGAALEGLVAQHLRAWADDAGTGCNLGFWRTSTGQEVDFVVHGEPGFWGIEVKHTGTIRGKDLRSLKAFRREYPEAAVRFLYQGKERLEIDGILCLPCAEYLREIVPGRPLP
jgi:predicted AAA+ superfamily ATPase